MLLMAALWMSPLLAAPPVAKLDKSFTVVIDAGHGGKDAGAVGRKYYEKNLNLDVSLMVGRRISELYPEIKVVYTRTTDVFLPLQKRADIVNQNNADLFICIHTNSSENRSAKGAETFILGTEKMEANLDVAMRENAVIKLESDYQTAYQGFDPNSIDSYIMFELMQNQYMENSLRFASLVQQQFSGTLHRADRGVRQAAFWVLLKSACPSVLIELGFISNIEEEQYMGSNEGKIELTEAIVTAFRQFYRKATPADKDVASVEKEPASTSLDSLSTPTDDVAPAEADTLSPTRKKIVDTVEKAEKAVKESKVAKAVWAAKEEKNETKEQYAVQVFAVKEKLKRFAPELKGHHNYGYQEIGGLYKYYIGPFSTAHEAAEQKTKLAKEFPGCFVIKL